MGTYELSKEKQFGGADDIKTSVTRLLIKKLFTDVEFRVGDGKLLKSFRVHKLFLACRSPVLADRFYKEQDTSVITVSDVGILGIEQMIRYIYFDDLVSYSAAGLKEGLKASLKFGIKSLETLCISSLIKLDINTENVYEVLKAADCIKHEEIRQKCLKIFANDTETLLNSSALRDASLDILLCIFQLSELNIDSEARLLEAAITWLQHNSNCLARDELLSCIDIMTLSIDEFLEVVEMFPRFFGDSEIVSILSNIRHFGSRNLPTFCKTRSDKRKLLKPKLKNLMLHKLEISDTGVQTSVLMLDESTQISSSEVHLFSSKKTSLLVRLEKSTEISAEEAYQFQSAETITTGTQTPSIVTLDQNTQISKCEANLFRLEETVNTEVQTTSPDTTDKSIQIPDGILSSNKSTQISKNERYMFISGEIRNKMVQTEFVAKMDKNTQISDHEFDSLCDENENVNMYTSLPSLSEQRVQVNAQWKRSRNERFRSHSEDQHKKVNSSSIKKNSRKNVFMDQLSISEERNISHEISPTFGSKNRIRISLIGDPNNKEELKIKFNVCDGTVTDELVTYYRYLKESSRFFSQLFNKGQHQLKLSSSDIQDLSFKGISDMIRFIEEHRITVKRLSDLPEIWKVAYVLGMEELRKYCEDRLANVCVTPDTVFEVIFPALKMGMLDIHMKCHSLISFRLYDIFKSPLFKTANSDFIFHVLKQEKLPLKSEADLLESIIPWLEEPENRCHRAAVLNKLAVLSLTLEEMEEIFDKFPEFFSSVEKRSIKANKKLFGKVQLPKWCDPSRESLTTIIDYTDMLKHYFTEDLFKTTLPELDELNLKKYFQLLHIQPNSGPFFSETSLQICSPNQLVMLELPFEINKNCKIALFSQTGINPTWQSVEYKAQGTPANYYLTFSKPITSNNCLTLKVKLETATEKNIFGFGAWNMTASDITPNDKKIPCVWKENQWCFIISKLYFSPMWNLERKIGSNYWKSTKCHVKYENLLQNILQPEF